MKYKYRHIDEVTKNEVKDLMNGEHGKAMEAWTTECVEAGYRKGLAAVVIATVISGVVSYAVKHARCGIIERHVRRNVNRLTNKLDVSE